MCNLSYCFRTLFAIAFCCIPSVAAQRPNVVFILTDNHGAWTLGCYGNTDIRTPHIDRLASEGMRFTRAFSSNGVCSPTRATYLTGLLPSQHGVHCYLRAGEAQTGPEAYSTIGEFRSLGEMLRDAGYECAMIGKWHLGANVTPQEGFSAKHWITMPHGATSTFYDAAVIEDGRTRNEPQYLTDLWTERSVEFIKDNRDRPFFLYLPYNGPYGLGRSLLLPARNAHAEHYADDLLLSFPRREPHPWLFNNRDYINNVQAMRRFAAELSAVDDGVERILRTLEELGLEENTLVIFTADQGWTGGQHGIWGMGDHTRPLHAFDGTMHIPLIFRHPGAIAAGTTSDAMTSNYDLLPTLMNYLGLEAPEQEPLTPGRDYSPILRGQPLEWKNVVYYDFENTRAVRTDEWKYVERFPDGPHELYDLSADPHEEFNLYGQPRQAEVQQRLRDRLHTFFQKHADPKYDLWRGGGSKTKLITAASFNVGHSLRE
ncbi:MAG: sulfatase-like hydrolase/transferase [Planctomycetes bacterium]|nr:sulfatase-like hydrolase/transferase [Planctomycetota bacterium]